MRPYSIRARVLYLAAVFSMLLVGSVTVTTYLLVADGMSNAAHETTMRLAQRVQRSASSLVDAVESDLAPETPSGNDGDAAFSMRARAALVEMLEAIECESGARYALYVPGSEGGVLDLAWSHDDVARAGSDDARTRAYVAGSIVLEGPLGRRLLAGLFGRADLGVCVAHVPVVLPDGVRFVIDVSYVPVREERVLDATRQPMLVVGTFALLAAVMMMQIIMGWVLSLVENVKAAADAIAGGRLDVRLPEEGGHEIAELARSLNVLVERLRQRADAQTRFVADASHELATPVAGIRGYVNILRAWGAEDPAMRDEAIAAIDRESRRMARLTSDLLAMIRSEEILEYRHVRYDINAVIREVLASAATRYLDKELEFVGPDEGPLWLHGDPDRIEEALGILVDNACKYTPTHGRVQVSSRRHKDRIVVEVSDTGVGIPQEDLPNIFERFYRSDQSRSKETGGFGLGLAIAKHIIDTSGGLIWVRSKVGAGTTFTISLPRNQQTTGAGGS